MKKALMKLADLRIKAIAVRSDLYNLSFELHKMWMSALDNKAPRAAEEIEEVLDAINYAIEHLQDVD